MALDSDREAPVKYRFIECGAAASRVACSPRWRPEDCRADPTRNGSLGLRGLIGERCFQKVRHYRDVDVTFDGQVNPSASAPCEDFD